MLPVGFVGGHALGARGKWHEKRSIKKSEYSNKNKKRNKILKNMLTNIDKCDILYLTNNRTELHDRREL